MSVLDSWGAVEWALLAFNLIVIFFGARFLKLRITLKLDAVEQRHLRQTAARSDQAGRDEER